MRRRILHRDFPWVLPIATAAIVGIGWTLSASAASYNVSSLLSSSQCRPDLPNCTPWYFEAPGDGTPMIDDNFVVFVSRSTSPGGIYDGIWSINIQSGKIKNLVGLNTPAPGGTGNFAYLGADQSIGDGVIVFTGYDAASVAGIYTVGVSGEQVNEIVTTNTAAPDGGLFTSWQQTVTNGRQVVFYGQTTTGRQGVYAAAVDGSGLTTVIDDTAQISDQGRWSLEAGPGYYSIFMRPVIGRSLISVYATENLDPSLFPNAILQTPGFTDVADTLTALEGDPTASASVHVVIGALSAALRTNELAFYAADNGGAFTGIFAAATIGSAQAFATNQTTLADGDQLASFGGFARDETGLAFVATPAQQTQTSIYFTPRAGGDIKLVAGGTNYYFPTLGDRALNKGNITFFNNTIYDNTIFLATPKN